jgi:hypothetical protein
MAVNLSPVGNAFQFFSNEGLPLAGGKLQTFQAGSTTPLATYTDSSGLVANTNPIILGTSGRPPETIWLEAGFFYKFVLSDANDVVIQTYDNLYGIIDAQPPSATPIPVGGILLWSGSIGSIPAGFVLCNGNNGTPDLRDRFIVGAGSNYVVNATGGSADSTLPIHTHGATSASISESVVTDPGHTHNAGSSVFVQTIEDGSSVRLSNNSGNATSSSTTGISVATTTTTTTTNANAGVSATNGNLPPYYALCYIMKT